MLNGEDLTVAIALVGDTPDGRLATVAQAIARQYSWDSVYPGFQLESLYVQRDLTKVAHGYAWLQVQEQQGPVVVHWEQQAKALAGRLAALETEIATRMEQARASGQVISIGQMTTTAPTTPPYPAPYPDRNDPLYQGTPYGRPPNPQGTQGTGW